MNTDKMLEPVKNNSYPLVEQNQQPSISSKDKRIISDQECATKRYHEFQQSTENSQAMYFNGIPQYSNQNASNAFKLQEQLPSPLRQQLLIYNKNIQPNIHLSSNSKAMIIPSFENKNQAIMDAQTLSCRKCGLLEIGPLTYESGKAAFCWGTALLFLTGIFCFMPCLGDKCKDVHVRCRACGHTKAVVPAKCCLL